MCDNLIVNAGLAAEPSVAGGMWHTFALKCDGTVWNWKRNNHGQIGDGTNGDRFLPVQAPSLANIVAIAYGFYYPLALKEDGTVWAWGRIMSVNWETAPLPWSIL